VTIDESTSEIIGVEKRERKEINDSSETEEHALINIAVARL